MTTNTEPTWVPTEGATETERDQEIDLGDGWHAILGQENEGWSWELWSTWLHDDESNIMATGFSPWEGTAKWAALKAYEKLV